MSAKLEEILTKHSIKFLHTFIADSARSEVDTLLIREILQTQFPAIQWAAPRMIPGSKKLEHYVWDDETQLIPNRWGILEPDPGTSQLLRIQKIDAVLVPLLAFDAQGHRVGYGGGYYDRFLPQCRPDTLKIGLSFFEPVKRIEDTEEWDVKLDVCVIPTRTYRWNTPS